MTETAIRHDWTIREAKALYALPLTELLFRAQSVHRQFHPPDAVQLCTLLSIKTGACPEDCSYCPQSGRNGADVEPERLLTVDEVLSKAKVAREAGATRFCMGAAWRDAREGEQFERVLTMVRGVRDLGMEACCTLGMLTDEQAARLKDAGLTAYNHNLDSSKEFYGEIITTRTYQERLDTISRVAGAGIHVCSGGIIGMGETLGDRLGMLVTLSSLTPHPESVPINALVAVEGTPLEDQPPVEPLELVRMCALARLMLPQSMVRLSAGRSRLNREAQLLAFMAGANSIFYGDKLLTTGNPDVEADMAMLRDAGMRALVPATDHAAAGTEPLPVTSAAPAPAE
ncbi:MAG: biotin synthase BioB [Deltaproteobacteria bacterium]|nr:biotin synthase BioB [Deltaproteobacteria bacterium]